MTTIDNDSGAIIVTPAKPKGQKRARRKARDAQAQPLTVFDVANKALRGMDRAIRAIPVPVRQAGTISLIGVALIAAHELMQRYNGE